MKLRAAWVLVLLSACGDDIAPAPPPTISSGPVTLDTQTMTLTLGAAPALVQPGFLAIGEVTSVDEAHYYDPRGEDGVDLVTVRARSMADGWLVLDGGTRLQLTACPIPECAILDIDASAHANAVQVQLALPREPAEPLYGTGDAAARANVAGTVREMSLRVDLGSDSSLNETHVPVPLVLWPRRGAGMFIADDRPGALDLGASDPTRVTATFNLPARGAYRVYLYTADAPLGLVQKYVALTAAPAVPPRWAFAPQQWRNAWNSSDEVRADAQEMRARKIPGSVMWIDNPWQTGYNTFVIDEARLADADALLAELTAQGYKVLFWSTPLVLNEGATAADYQEGARHNYFATSDTGGVINWPWKHGPAALVDFTREGATAWWRERIARVVSRGAAGFKLDYGEELLTDVGGSILTSMLAAGDNSSHHNRYANGYHEAYLGALPDEDKFLITRAGAWGEQAVNPAIWPGDLDGTFTEHGALVGGKRAVGGLPSAIARGLALSVSGYPFYGSDIGGYRDFPTTELLIRWAQYASMGTIMQLGGGGKSHNPWDTSLFDPGADLIYKKYADLHMQLNPLLWTLAQQAGTDGTPVTRPAGFMYDCACDDATFLLGDDILVAPVITPGATSRTVVLPPGEWVDRWTGEVMAGGSTVTVPAPLEALPMWHRVGSLVPMFARSADTLVPASAPGVTSYANPAFGRELRLVYTPGAPATTTLHDTAHASADGAMVSVTGGSQYTVFTLDVDARALTGALAAPSAVAVDGSDLIPVTSSAELAACAAPGCWYADAANQHLQVRVYAPTGETRAVIVR